MDAIDFTAYTRAQWERNCQLAAAVIVVYEYSIHFGNEVDHFWKQSWSFPKVLFLWSRYYSTAYNIGNAVIFVYSQVTEELCIKFFHWQNFGAALQYITTQVILQMRLYAMYGQSKKLLAFFITLICCESAVIGVLFGLPRDGLVGTNNPLPGLFICADADPPNNHWMAYVPTAILITETIFLCLALNKAWEHYRDGIGGRMIPWLTKESVYFFIPIFFIHLANQIIWMVNKLTLNELVTGLSFAIPAVLANRLLLSLRTHNTQPDYLSDSMFTQGTVVFQRYSGSRRRDSTFDNVPAIELTSARDRGENK